MVTRVTINKLVPLFALMKPCFLCCKFSPPCHEDAERGHYFFCQNHTCYNNKGATPLYDGDVPDGSGPISMDDVECVGTETRLIDCPASAYGVYDCDHSEDVGLTCLSRGTVITP